MSRTLSTLEPLVASLQFAEEGRLLKTFRAAHDRVWTLDREILALAVENTNLKAQRLSFGPAYEAANTVGAALDAIVASIVGVDAARARSLASTVLLKVRELEVLEGPHIAEADDAAMTKLERRMTTLQSEARQVLDELANMSAAGRAADVEPARTALVGFLNVHDEILKLSRRNSDVRSLALSLGEKRTLTAVCEENLDELRQRLMERTFPARR